MLKFIKKSILFTIILLLIILSFLISYQIKNDKINGKTSSNSIFIWGDSQAKAGFDLELLKNKTMNNIYSASAGGAGAFDFLVFVENVPDNSIVIISISQLSLLRERDKSNTGIPVYSIPYLTMINYPSLLYSIRRNVKPKNIYHNNVQLYPFRDTLTLHEPLEKFKEIYLNDSKKSNIKEKAYLYGIEKLVNRNCKILCVKFPIHSNLYDIIPPKLKEDNSEFDSEILIKIGNEVELNFDFTSQNRNMYDLTHLNEKGARDFTEYLCQFLSLNSDKNVFIRINNGASN